MDPRTWQLGSGSPGSGSAWEDGLKVLTHCFFIKLGLATLQPCRAVALATQGQVEWSGRDWPAAGAWRVWLPGGPFAAMAAAARARVAHLLRQLQRAAWVQAGGEGGSEGTYVVQHMLACDGVTKCALHLELCGYGTFCSVLLPLRKQAQPKRPGSHWQAVQTLGQWPRQTDISTQHIFTGCYVPKTKSV